MFTLRTPVLPSCKRVEFDLATLANLVIVATRALLW